MNNRTVRAFICIEINSAVAESLANIITDARQFSEHVSWAKPEKIHLTLKFLGDIEPENIARIKQILERLAIAHAAFTIDIDTLGAFPNFQRPRVFWAGASAVPDALTAVVTGLEDALAQIGFAKERRPFAPHLTLGRAKSERCSHTADFLKQYPVKPLRISCEEIVLMQSELKPDGAVYTPLAKYKMPAK